MNISNNHINGLLDEMHLDKDDVTDWEGVMSGHCFGMMLETDQVVALGIAIVRVIGDQKLVDALGKEAVIEPQGDEYTLVFWPGVMCPDWEGVKEVKKSFAEAT